MYKKCSCRSNCMCHKCNKVCKQFECKKINTVLAEKCKCGYDEDCKGLPEYPELAQSYVPIQEFNETFCPETALRMGTLFPELVRPYEPNQSICEQERIESLNRRVVCNYACMRNE